MRVEIEQAGNHRLRIGELNALGVRRGDGEIAADAQELAGADENAGIANSLVACRCEQPSASYEYVTLLRRILRSRKTRGDERQEQQCEALHLHGVAVPGWPCTKQLASDVKRT